MSSEPDAAPLAPDAVAERVARLPELRELLGSDDAEVQLRAARDVCHVLSLEDFPAIQATIDAGVVPPLVAFLGRADTSTELLVEATRALCSIAGGTSDHVQAVVERGAVPRFVSLLDHTCADITDQAAWALSYIALDSPDTRDAVIDCGALPKFMRCVTTDTRRPELVRICARAMCNLFAGKPGPPISKVVAGLPVLTALTRHAEGNVAQDACLALAYFSEGHSDRVQAVIDAGCVPRVVELLAHQSPSLVTPALRCVGNVANGNNAQKQVVLDTNVVPFLATLLDHAKQSIREDTCWTFSNIAAGTSSHIQALVDGDIVPLVVDLLRTDVLDVRREALRVITNLASGGSREQVEYVVAQGAIPALAGVLACDDGSMVIKALEGLKKILTVERTRTGSPEERPWRDMVKERGGVDLLQSLWRHPSRDVYRLATHILLIFFPTADAGDGRRSNNDGDGDGDETKQEPPCAAPDGAAERTASGNDTSAAANVATGARSLGAAPVARAAERSSESVGEGGAAGEPDLDGDGGWRGDDEDDEGGAGSDNDGADDGGGDFVF